MEISESVLSALDKDKLLALENEKVNKIIEEYVNLCKPSKVTIITDSDEDIDYIKKMSLKLGEEKELKTKGHTIHFDGYFDQARDKKNTKILVPKGQTISKHLNTADRSESLIEINQKMNGIMVGKELFVRFFCLGPKDSKFSLLALQLTDSAYVAHSEDILYRKGYDQFKKMQNKDLFFYFVHSAGELDERGNTKNIDKRRIYIDLEENRVFTINNQYAGNSLGLKKLALRLAIKKSHGEGWLTEHMFVMGVKPKDKNRITYFTGAYPSACGKTSTAMIPGQTIIGDDIAYLRVWDDGTCHAVNVEQGIFGIIKDVNESDDPLIYSCLTTPRELIFSNVLINDGQPYWENMGVEVPNSGENSSGEWTPGKKGSDGNEIDFSHKNARYTIRLSELENIDVNSENPNGVPIQGILYGGRDSDTFMPIMQSLSWAHGVFLGASLESETTAATLGSAGVLAHSPMANLDFLVVPLGTYIQKHIEFGEKLDKQPLIFATNYFLKNKSGKYLNEKVDKKVWVLWAEGRVHGDYGAMETPIGFIPKYDDLKLLFKEIFNRDYSKEEYVEQFSLCVDNVLKKLERINAIYESEDVPKEFEEHLFQQKKRLEKIKNEKNASVISPFEFEKN